MRNLSLIALFLAVAALAATFIPFSGQDTIYRAVIDWGPWPDARNQTVFESVKITYPDDTRFVWIVSYLRGVDVTGSVVANEMNAQLVYSNDIGQASQIPDLVFGSSLVEYGFEGKVPK